MKPALEKVQDMIHYLESLEWRLSVKHHSPIIRTAHRQTSTCLEELEWLRICLEDVIQEGATKK